jgi:hypothetical protein
MATAIHALLAATDHPETVPDHPDALPDGDPSTGDE